MTKWPNERLVKTRVVSGFIFLRLLCPAILNPRQFNLLSGMKRSVQWAEGWWGVGVEIIILEDDRVIVM